MADSNDSVVAFWEALPLGLGAVAYDHAGNPLCSIFPSMATPPFAVYFNKSVSSVRPPVFRVAKGPRLADWKDAIESALNEIMPAIYAEALAKAGQE